MTNLSINEWNAKKAEEQDARLFLAAETSAKATGRTVAQWYMDQMKLADELTKLGILQPWVQPHELEQFFDSEYGD